ncbi:MAG: hypothetical protein V3W44_04345 [Dehalococcoidales bacterium]
MPTTMEEKGVQTIPSTQVDIPDANAQEAPKIELPAPVKAERDIRRYIRPDGVFVKDLARAFDNPTSTAKDGTAVLTPTFTDEEAEQHVRNLCEQSGRDVTTDYLTKRPKAVPGWDFNIQVPGMAQSEQKRPKAPDGETRIKVAEGAVAQLQEANQELQATVEQLAKNFEALTREAPPDKPLGQMNHVELDKFALDNTGQREGWSELNKSEKRADIKERLEASSD